MKYYLPKTDASRGLVPRFVCAQYGHSPKRVQARGARSFVYETMKRKTPAEANCGSASDRGKEGYATAHREALLKGLANTAEPEGIKPRSDEQEPHTRPAWLGHTGGASWHNTAKPTGLAMKVNVADVRWRTVSLPGEISSARDRESGSAECRNALGDGREVSRSHSAIKWNRGAVILPE